MRDRDRKENPQKPFARGRCGLRRVARARRERERERERAAKGYPAMEFVDALTGFRVDGRRPNEVTPTCPFPPPHLA